MRRRLQKERQTHRRVKRDKNEQAGSAAESVMLKTLTPIAHHMVDAHIRRRILSQDNELDQRTEGAKAEEYR